jgi:hypothetical protein
VLALDGASIGGLFCNTADKDAEAASALALSLTRPSSGFSVHPRISKDKTHRIEEKRNSCKAGTQWWTDTGEIIAMNCGVYLKLRHEKRLEPH